MYKSIQKLYTKSYIKKHNTCKGDRTIGTKVEKIEKNEDEMTYIKEKKK